jgi:hypothetical protein
MGADTLRNLATVGIVIGSATWWLEIDDRREARELEQVSAYDGLRRALNSATEEERGLDTSRIIKWLSEYGGIVERITLNFGLVAVFADTGAPVNFSRIRASDGGGLIYVNDGDGLMNAFGLMAENGGQLILAGQNGVHATAITLASEGSLLIRGHTLSARWVEADNGVVILSPDARLNVETTDQQRRRTTYSGCRWRHCAVETNSSVEHTKMRDGALHIGTSNVVLNGVDLSGVRVIFDDPEIGITIGERGFCYDEHTTFEIYRGRLLTIESDTPEIPLSGPCVVDRAAVRMPLLTDPLPSSTNEQ